MFSYTKIMQTISSVNAWNVARVRVNQAAFFVTNGGAFDDLYDNASSGLYIHPQNSNVYVCGDSNIYRISVQGNLVVDSFENVNPLQGYTQAANVAATAVTPRAVFFRPEGNVVFVLDGQRQRIQQYSVTSNFTYSGITSTFVSGNLRSTEAMHFSSDGTKVFVLSTDDNVRQYSLNVAWTANSINIASNIAFSVLTQTNAARSMTFDAAGTKMYIGATTERVVYQYNLSSAWNISTTTYSNVAFSTQTPLAIDGRNVSPAAISFSSDGSNFVALDANSPFPIVKWNVVTPWDLSTAYYYNPSYVSVNNFAFPWATPDSFFMTPDGSNIFFLKTTGADSVLQYRLSQAWNFSSNISFVGQGFLNTSVGTGLPAINEFYVREDIARLYATSSDDNVYQYSITTPGNVASITYSQRDVPSAGSSLYGPWFRPDGTREYVIDIVNDVIRQYNLTSVWNVSSRTTTGQSTLSYGGTVGVSVQTSTDGIYFFIATTSTGSRFTKAQIRSWTTNTAYQLANVGSPISLSTGAFLPSGVTNFVWNPSGTQFYRIITGFSSAINSVTFVTYTVY